MDNLTSGVAEAVRADMEAAGVSVLALSNATHIPYATLSRRLSGGPFTTAELSAIGQALNKQPSDWLQAAESGAA